MADADFRKERFQGQTLDRPEDTLLHQRYLKMKQERDADKSRENASRVNLEDAVDIVGTCDMMCPEFESLQRYFERDLDPFEKSPNGAYDRSLMVQAFARAAAGNDLPPLEDIRPPPLLRVTVDYLLDNILVRFGIEATHNFIWNRTRAVRSDLTRQRDHSANSIYCLERIIRYHILAFHEVCRGQREIETLEIEQLKKALQSLTEVYHDARAEYTSPNEAEFRSYYILMHIRSRHAPFTLRSLPPAVYSAPILQWALRIRFTLSRNNDGADEHNSDVTQMDYAGFFDILSQPSTSFLTSCLLETHFDDIRRQMCLMLGLSLKNTARVVTVPQFQSLLHLDTVEEALGWISHLKWTLGNSGILEIPQSRKADVLLPPIATATPFPRTKSALVQFKKKVPGLPTHISAGMLDSIITRHGGSKFGRGYVDPPAIPRKRRRAEAPTNLIMSQGFAPGATFKPPSAPVIHPPTAFVPQPFSHARPQQPPVPVAPFNPFGRKAVTPNPTAATQATFNPAGQPWSTPVSQSTFPPRLTSTQPSFQPPTTPMPSFATTPSNPFGTNPAPSAFTTAPPVTFAPPAFPSHPPAFTPSTLLPQAIPKSESIPPVTTSVPAQAPIPAPVVPAPQPPIPAVVPPMRTPDVPIAGPPKFMSKPPMKFKEVLPPPASFGHSFSIAEYQTDSGVDTTPPARPFDLNRPLSDGYMSADSSIMPASTHPGAEDSPPGRVDDMQEIDARSNASSATADGAVELVPATRQLDTRAQEHNRISTLRSFVQQWRETSAKTKEKSEIHARKEKAEQSALDIPLGVQFTGNQQDFTKSMSQKRITQKMDTTQAFMLAEKEAHDRKIWAPGTFTRIASQVAKRRRGGKDLPPGWQIWTSIVPGNGETSKWYKMKLTGDENAPDLANITIGPPANDEIVAAPGLLVLQIEPRAWDTNLRRAKELLDFLPSDSPYLPGLILTMIANPKHADFPKTWVTKLDRLLQGTVMDRRGVVFTSVDSAQAIDELFSTRINELNFDVEGRAPRLSFKELLQEYLNWWNVEYQYGREQATIPTVDWDITLLVVSVLMSGLDELLRQIILQCQVSDLDIPFNNFQSKHDIEEACTEMLEYLKALGGNLRRLPITPAAILQDPDILFQILSRIFNTLSDRLLQQQDTLFPRLGLRRSVLEQLGREYNEKLERELLLIDRSALIYASRDTEMNNSASLKRKRRSSDYTNGVNIPASSPENDTEISPKLRTVNAKRSRVSLEQPAATPEPPLKLSFKVEMAKARLDLRVLQAVDLDNFPDPTKRAAAQAKMLVEIADPLVDKILISDVPSDKDVVECRAALELVAHAEEPVFDQLAQAKSLAISVERLARLSGVGNLEFRELVNSAKRLSEHLSY